jgi:hypothetical protein
MAGQNPLSNFLEERIAYLCLAIDASDMNRVLNRLTRILEVHVDCGEQIAATGGTDPLIRRYVDNLANTQRTHCQISVMDKVR